MVSVKATELYNEVIMELNYAYGNVFIFKGFIVSEINGGVSLSWDLHAKKMVEDVANYLETNGENLIYISNRINSYSVKATDWLKFFKLGFNLKAYFIVSNTPSGKLNIMIENLFFNNKIQHFSSIYDAVNHAKTFDYENA